MPLKAQCTPLHGFVPLHFAQNYVRQLSKIWTFLSKGLTGFPENKAKQTKLATFSFPFSPHPGTELGHTTGPPGRFDAIMGLSFISHDIFS